MKNTKEAIKYGIKTLKVSPDEMFALIKSSDGYSGENYKRWLANEIIKIANKEGVGYSQLLVKKFSIIQSISEEYESDGDEIKQRFYDMFSKVLGEKIYSVGMNKVGISLDEVDWYNGIDIDDVNSAFVMGTLPADFREDFVNGEFSLFARLQCSNPPKNSDLLKDAKEYGLVCKNEGSLMLYRVCSLVEAFGYSNKFRFGFLVNSTFLYDKDNADIIKYFLSYFVYKGLIIKSSDMYESGQVGGEYAFVVCTPRGAEDRTQDGFVLRDYTDDKLKASNMVKRRFSRSYIDMLEYIKSGVRKLPEGEKIYGYLCYNPLSSTGMWLSSSAECDTSIPITRSNIDSIIVYYGVSQSMANFGMFTGVNDIMTGSTGYTELLYNCVPIFLYDINSHMRGDAVPAFLIKEMFDVGEVYFGYEAKELISVCKSIVDDLPEGASISETIVNSGNDDIVSYYMTALSNLKDYVSMLYRKME